jgi:hypothetical protein
MKRDWTDKKSQVLRTYVRTRRTDSQQSTSDVPVRLYGVRAHIPIRGLTVGVGVVSREGFFLYQFNSYRIDLKLLGCIQ